MFTLGKATVFALLLTAGLGSSGKAQGQAAVRRFTIYEFIPYRAHVDGNEVSNVPQLDQYLESVGLHKIQVIYLNRFMTDGQPDEKKIEAVAKASLSAPKVPVSFDTEFGDRYKPESVIPGVSEILRIYHEANNVTPAGVYATAPQNTYAWKPDIAHFDSLNEQYESIAQQVDFLSPVLYNYEGPDNAAWQRAAVYNMSAAKAYKTGKPIYPYISPVIRIKESGKDDQSQRGPVRMLSEAEMMLRLETLYGLGADGCIVWASSGDRTIDGNMPVFDRNSGWGKALTEFAAAHR